MIGYGASLGQVPPTSTTNSYISFSEVDNIIFKIKSNDISSSEIKEGGNLLERSLFDSGYKDIYNWKEVIISVPSFRATKMKIALALSITCGKLGRKIEIKDIGFINSNGENANKSHVIPNYS